MLQGGSLWPGRALERQCITRAAPRGGLGSIRLSDQHSMRGFPRRPKVALSRICDPPGLCGRWGAQGAARGAVWVLSSVGFLTAAQVVCAIA